MTDNDVTEPHVNILYCSTACAERIVLPAEPEGFHILSQQLIPIIINKKAIIVNKVINLLLQSNAYITVIKMLK